MVNWKRVAFWAILFYLFYTAPTEGQMKPITLNIYPKLALASAFKRTTIRVEWHIARHPDNRRWAFSYESDNGDVSSSQGSLNGDSPVIYPICTNDNPRPCFREVLPGTYWFSACVYRVEENKVKPYCDHYTLEVRGG